MRYRFMVLADLHWGAMDSTYTYQNLQLVLKFIRKMQGQLDFLVIAGDYFDYRIQLNSKSALYGVKWFEELMRACQESGVRKVRMFKGTAEHDNDQLEVFRPVYEDDTGYFRLFNETTSEQLFDDLRVIYCPDETVNMLDYDDLRWAQFVPNPDIGFFHGNFDRILATLEYNRIRAHHLPTMVYEYAKFSRLVKGPLIAGHWHTAQNLGALYYVGSYDRWKFGEEEPKGFIYGEYDTDTEKYLIHRVINPWARVYKTLVVTDEETISPAEFAVLGETVLKELEADPEMRLRVTYLISTGDDEARTNFDTLHRQLANHRRVTVDIKNLLKKEEKKRKTQQVQLSAQEYQYVYNKDIKAIPAIIQRFLHEKRHEDLSLETIEKHIGKYLNA